MEFYATKNIAYDLLEKRLKSTLFNRYIYSYIRLKNEYRSGSTHIYMIVGYAEAPLVKVSADRWSDR